MKITRESQFSGFWEPESKTVASRKMTGSLVAEAIPGGRFNAEIRNYSIPRDSTPGDLFYGRKSLSYDGNAYLEIELPLDDPPPGKAHVGSVTIRNDDKFSSAEIADSFPLVAVMAFRFESLIGSIDDLSINSIKIRTEKDTIILETLDVPGGNGYQKEILWIRVAPELQPFKYSNRLVDSSGNILTEESWQASEFSKYKNTLLSFPKSVERVVTRVQSNGRKLTRRDVYNIESFGIEPYSEALFSPRLKPGYFVKDERLGISFRVGEAPSKIYKSLERIKNP